MVIGFDPRTTTDTELGQVIQEMGYTIERVDLKSLSNIGTQRVGRLAPFPPDARRFFRESFSAAAEKRRPILVAFGASWCAPCVPLKKDTFADGEVIPWLERFQVIYVDLDENSELGELYGVTAVPHVFIINGDGRVVDEFNNFEPPLPFLKRLRKALDPALQEGTHTGG